MRKIILITFIIFTCLSIFAQSDGKYEILETEEFYVRDTAIIELIEEHSSGATTTASNGLTKDGQNFKMGGTLEESTEIEAAGYSITMGTSTSQANTFNVYGNEANFNLEGEMKIDVDGNEWVFDGVYWISDTGDTLMNNTLTDNKIEAAVPNIPFNFNYSLDLTTTDDRPGVGKFKLNSAVYSSVTQINIDYFDSESVSKSNFLALPDTGSYITITDGTNYINYQFSGAVEDVGSYFRWDVDYLNHSGVVSGGLTVSLDLSNNTGGSGGSSDSSYIAISTDTLFLPNASELDTAKIYLDDSDLIIQAPGTKGMILNTDDKITVEAGILDMNITGDFQLSSPNISQFSAGDATIVGEDSLTLYAENEGVAIKSNLGNVGITTKTSFYNFDGDVFDASGSTVDVRDLSSVSDIATSGGELITERNQTSGGFAKLTSLSGSVMLPGFWTQSEDLSKGFYILSVADNAATTGYSDAAIYMNARKNDASPLTTGKLLAVVNGQDEKVYVDVDGGIYTVAKQTSGGYLTARSGSGSIMLPSIWGRSESSAQGISLLAFPDDLSATGFSDGGVNITIRKNDATPVTSGNLIQVSNQSEPHFSIDHDGFAQFIRSPRSFVEFASEGVDLKMAVGRLGASEANISFNMDYRTGVHKLYDTTLNAFWYAMNNNGVFLQYAPDTTGLTDIWGDNDKAFYAYAVDTAGRFAINIPKGYVFGNENLYVNGDAKIDGSILMSEETLTDHEEGRVYYDSGTNGLILDDDISGKWNIGSEVGARYYNPTASQINDGDIVRLTGSHEVGGVVYGAVELAGNMSEDSTDVLGAATTNITSLGFGRCTFLGQINNINTTGLTGKFYLGNAGQKLNDPPLPPARSVLLGYILTTDATTGAAQLSPQQAVYSPNPTFSAFFEEVGETIENPAIDTYAPITNAANDLFVEQRNFGFDFVGDSISPKQDGTYTIFFSYSFYGEASQTDLYRIGTFVDGVKQLSLPRTASGTSTGGVPYPVTLTLTAGQWISFKVKNTTSGSRDCLFDSAVITINYN